MKLKKQIKETILKEYDFVIPKMKENAEDPDTLIFYFSAAYTVLDRMYNNDFNDDLLFAHQVLINVYNSFARVIRSNKAGENTIPLTISSCETLINYLKEFRKVIEKEENTYHILLKFTKLGYSLQGNGYYLQQKGMITL
ncbi:MAG: hypothetical protein HOD92_13995 [Deltaproteobacteria bacterium]|nr:hypothetical protein [Deltaproteobacteria bacterium]MBT4526376.1 hypothetical protein [Deltaproteobacteria bacterium]